MFENNDKEYIEAVKDAQVHMYQEKRGVSSKLIVINIVLSLILLILSYFYFIHKSTALNESIKIHKVAVLGVSHTSTKSEYSDNELLSILEHTDVDEIATIEKKIDTNHQSNLNSAMNELVNQSKGTVESTYKEAISKELDDKHTFRGRVVLVKKGDTLSNLAERYYGDAKAYGKIIDYNINMSETSHTLHVGDKINIPY